MKISVITVVFNGEETIEETILSVRRQSYPNVEHIIVDGASTDGTMKAVAAYRESIAKIVSEPDKGIYDAMNKGIKLATGDVIGFLNADDRFAASDVLMRVAETFSDASVDACYGDLVYVNPDNREKIVRYYRSDSFSPSLLRKGVMPAHPTLYLRRELFDKFGVFKTDYEIAGDFELVARIFSRDRLVYRYLPFVMVRMDSGGISTRGLHSNVLLNREIIRACQENGISTSLFQVYSKYFRKLFQLFRRPKEER